MALPTLPDGYGFTVNIIEGPRIAVAIVATADGSVQSNGFLDATPITTETQLTTDVETEAGRQASLFNKAQNMQTWVDAHWPAPVPTDPPA